MRYTVGLIAAFAAVGFAGCYFGNQTIEIPGDEPIDYVIAEIGPTDCVVYLRDGTKFEEAQISFAGDSGLVVQSGISGRRVHPFSGVWKITTQDPGRGSAWGFVTGVAAGVLIGVLAGKDESSMVTREGLALAGGLLFGVSGAAIGALGGGRTTYRFQAETARAAK
jgi:hypothetical protein